MVKISSSVTITIFILTIILNHKVAVDLLLAVSWMFFGLEQQSLLPPLIGPCMTAFFLSGYDQQQGFCLLPSPALHTKCRMLLFVLNKLCVEFHLKTHEFAN